MPSYTYFGDIPCPFSLSSPPVIFFLETTSPVIWLLENIKTVTKIWLRIMIDFALNV